MKPVSDVYDPFIMKGPAILEWLQKEMPAEYERMKAGEEIGYKRIIGLYKKAHKK